MMLRTLQFIALASLLVSMAGCYAPEPRPFAGRGGRSLDRPPRYGETNRYVQPGPPGNTPPPPPQRMAVDPDIDPRTVPPGVDLTPPPGLPAPIDRGLTATPPTNGPAPSATPQTAPTTAPGTTATPTPPPTTADAPYARPVPGKPGFVYSPHEAGKILDVTGLRPGTKVKDPQTGAVFRVP
jgi:hypothetical protein